MTSIGCFCSNTNLSASIVQQAADEWHLHVHNLAPEAGHGGHVHLDVADFGVGEGDTLTLREMGGDKILRWRGSTNYIEMGAGVEGQTFRIERE